MESENSDENHSGMHAFTLMNQSGVVFLNVWGESQEAPTSWVKVSFESDHFIFSCWLNFLQGHIQLTFLLTPKEKERVEPQEGMGRGPGGEKWGKAGGLRGAVWAAVSRTGCGRLGLGGRKTGGEGSVAAEAPSWGLETRMLITPPLSTQAMRR